MTSPARPASEPEASQAARLRREGHDRRAWLNAIHVPRRWSLRRGGDTRLPVVGFGWPVVVRPCLRDTRQCAGLGHSLSVALEYDVRVADRHRDRTPRIAREIVPFHVLAPVWNQNVPSSHRAPTAVTCGLPSLLTVDSQVVREFAASGAGADPASSFSASGRDAGSARRVVRRARDHQHVLPARGDRRSGTGMGCAAALHLAFAGLDAGASVRGQRRSNRVSRALGYEPDGTG